MSEQTTDFRKILEDNAMRNLNSVEEMLQQAADGMGKEFEGIGPAVMAIAFALLGVKDELERIGNMLEDMQ